MKKSISRRASRSHAAVKMAERIIRTELGGGIDWTEEPADDEERAVRALALSRVASHGILTIMYLLGRPDKSTWPSDVVALYEERREEDDGEFRVGLAERMHCRVQCARRGMECKLDVDEFDEEDDEE